MLVQSAANLQQDADFIRNTVAGVSAFLALCALALGMVNFQRAKKLDKRDLFLRLHEALVEPEVVAGRRALYKIKTTDGAAAACVDEQTSSRIYRALALFDVLALYVESKWIDEGTVLKEWSNSLVRSTEPAELWMAERYKGVEWHSWPHYQALASKAARVERGRRELAEGRHAAG
jgi:hypothetical protein